MGSVAIMYIPTFITIGSGIRKFMERGVHGNCISLLLFFAK
jgi:hypothetical protein